MRITILPDAVRDQTNWRFLDRILQRIEDGAHEWEILDPDELAESDWLAQLRSWHRPFFEGAAKKSAYPSEAIFCRQLFVSTKAVSTLPSQCDLLPPEKAAVFVRQPLYVLLENEFTDGVFLNTVIAFLGVGALVHLHNQASVGLIKYVNAGGNGEIPKQIDKQVQEAKDLGLPLRVVVFTDSDSKYPGDLDKNASLVQEKSALHGIPCCMLKKRAIENYIPDEIFNEWLKNKANSGYKHKVAALLGFSPLQRDYFSIKKGFKAEHTPPAGKADLYANVLNEGKEHLMQGFGDEVIHWLRTYEHVLSAKALRKRDHGGDLDQLMAMIMAEL